MTTPNVITELSMNSTPATWTEVRNTAYQLSSLMGWWVDWLTSGDVVDQGHDLADFTGRLRKA